MPTNGATQHADVAIPIVFPDYRITVDTPEVAVTVPDLIPWGNVLPDRFMKGKPWVRHDEHYHVDFAAPCKPHSG